MERVKRNAQVHLLVMEGNTSIHVCSNIQKKQKDVTLNYEIVYVGKCRGPGWKTSDLESNRIIGQNQADKAIELFDHGDKLMTLSGPIDYRQKYWDISNAVINHEDGTNASTCPAAMVK